MIRDEADVVPLTPDCHGWSVGYPMPPHRSGRGRQTVRLQHLDLTANRVFGHRQKIRRVGQKAAASMPAFSTYA